jgi:hypothetical protein
MTSLKSDRSRNARNIIDNIIKSNPEHRRRIPKKINIEKKDEYGYVLRELSEEIIEKKKDESENEIVKKGKKKTINISDESEDFSDENGTNENDPYVGNYYNIDDMNDQFDHENMGMNDSIYDSDIYTNRRSFERTSPRRTGSRRSDTPYWDGKNNKKFYEGIGNSFMNSIDLCESPPQSRKEEVYVESPSRNRAHTDRANRLKKKHVERSYGKGTHADRADELESPPRSRERPAYVVSPSRSRTYMNEADRLRETHLGSAFRNRSHTERANELKESITKRLDFKKSKKPNERDFKMIKSLIDQYQELLENRTESSSESEEEGKGNSVSESDSEIEPELGDILRAKGLFRKLWKEDQRSQKVSVDPRRIQNILRNLPEVKVETFQKFKEALKEEAETYDWPEYILDLTAPEWDAKKKESSFDTVRRKEAYSVITKKIHPDIKRCVKDANKIGDAQALYRRLHNFIVRDTEDYILELKGNITNSWRYGCKKRTVGEYGAYLKEKHDLLESLGEPLEERELVQIYRKGLPRRLETQELEIKNFPNRYYNLATARNYVESFCRDKRLDLMKFTNDSKYKLMTDKRVEKSNFYRHGSDDSKDKKDRPCPFFTRGSCRKGDTCDMKHVKVEKPSQECSYYRNNGECKYGDKCKFRHSQKSNNTEDKKDSNDEQDEDELPQEEHSEVYSGMFTVIETDKKDRRKNLMNQYQELLENNTDSS